MATEIIRTQTGKGSSEKQEPSKEDGRLSPKIQFRQIRTKPNGNSSPRKRQVTEEETKQENRKQQHRQICLQTTIWLTNVFPTRGTTSHQHVCGIEVVLAGHALLQLLRYLLDVLNLIQQVQDMFVLNAFNPQLAQLIPLAVQQHLT